MVAHTPVRTETPPEIETAFDEPDALVDEAVELARRLLAASLADESRAEHRRHERLGRLLEDPAARELIFALTDEVLRIESPQLAAHRFADVVDRHPSRALGALDRVLLRLGAALAPRVPRLVMPLVTRRIKAETRGIVLPADDPAFGRHLRRRGEDGVDLIVNCLGEAILSDDAAEARVRQLLERIARADVDYVSVKISAIVANLDPLAFDDGIARVCDQLRVLYRAAQATTPRTFVNLDMEEYHDLELTLQSFMRVLDEDEFAAIDAGIVLQAYLPDSHEALERLGQWARRRFERAGGHVKVRLVKGANLAMEEVEGELHGWLPAPYGSKADVDASFKAMLDSALRTEWSGALRVGVASHNLFDIAWALVVARQLDARDRVDIEMLEGMAPAQARAVYAAAGELLMYAPVVADEDFDASIAYLSRRLDENTQPDNFLRSLFTLRPNTPAFDREAERFRRSVAGRVNVSRRRHRRPLQPVAGSFANQPDSDMTDPEVRAAIGRAIGSPRRRPTPHADIPAIDATVAAAAVVADTPHSPEERALWLRDAADLMQRERAETIGLMARTVAKTAREGDPEVSEAIDFCRYYGTHGLGALEQAQEAGMRVEARGVVAVIAPWNFPYAIPTGGVAAALAAGNSVILKPAPEALELGAWIADQFWRAGVPRDVLHLVICDDGPVGTHLVTHPDIDTVVLTGSYDTAAMFLDWRPDLRVLAETSGKNALVVTASADLDLAIADLVRSAFGHAGQKCSAASLGIIEAAVYDDPAFQRRLREAVRSLRVLPATDPASMMGPVIAPPAAKLERALTTLESGEWWLVRPQPSSDDGRLWTPGVRVGVEPGSWFHLTECFGPVLGLMRARDLDHAIELQNAPEFGLTGGIHSLDVEEIERWLAGVQIGNAYVNRHITGAIVRRQPFGGWKHSSVGGGAKAGGPGYVPQFARISDPAPSVDAARASYEAAWRDRYAVEHDPSGLRCESNVLRYRPLARVAVRHDGDDETALAMLRAAAAVAGVEVVESDARTEPADRFVERLDGVDRVRLLGDLDDEARRVAHRANVPIDAEPPVGDGMVELQHWVREQAISRTRHRHGRLVD